MFAVPTAGWNCGLQLSDWLVGCCLSQSGYRLSVVGD